MCSVHTACCLDWVYEYPPGTSLLELAHHQSLMSHSTLSSSKIRQIKLPMSPWHSLHVRPWWPSAPLHPSHSRTTAPDDKTCTPPDPHTPHYNTHSKGCCSVPQCYLHVKSFLHLLPSPNHSLPPWLSPSTRLSWFHY